MAGLDPAIQGRHRFRLLLWMGGSEAAHGEVMVGSIRTESSYFFRNESRLTTSAGAAGFSAGASSASGSSGLA